MQYLVSVIHDGTGPATPTEDAAIDAFNDQLRAEGYWVFAGGLGSPEPATVVDNRGSSRCSPTGPSWSRRSTSPASGHRGPDLDVALKLATEGSKACNRKSRCARSC